MKLNLNKGNKSIIFVSLMVFVILFSVACIYASDVNNSCDSSDSVELTEGLSHHADLNNVSEKTLTNDTAAVTDNNVPDKTVSNDSVAASDRACLNKMFDSAMAYDTVKFCNPNHHGKISDMYITYVPEDNSSSDNNFTMSARYVGGTGYHWIVSDETYGVDLVSVYNEVDHPKL